MQTNNAYIKSASINCPNQMCHHALGTRKIQVVNYLKDSYFFHFFILQLTWNNMTITEKKSKELLNKQNKLVN